MVRIIVMYVDDFGKKHYTFMTSLSEVHSLKVRYSEVEIIEYFRR